MIAKTIVSAVLLLTIKNLAADPARSIEGPEFMGRKVTLTEAETDEDGLFPKGPASLCVEGPPERQCYTAPKDFGRMPTAAGVMLAKDIPALLFSAASGGVSGFNIHFALLRPRSGKELDDLFQGGITVSNQNQYAFWTESAISDTPIFVTADYVWGPTEGHYDAHRYLISVYVAEGLYYYLDDRYMTVRKYDQEANPDIPGSEKPEILARLKRVKAERERRQPTPAR